MSLKAPGFDGRNSPTCRETSGPLIWALTFCAVATAVLPAPALSQSVSGPRLDSAALRARFARVMDRPGWATPPDVAQLNTMLEQYNMRPLIARLIEAHAPREIASDMDWESSKIIHGSGYIISLAYMSDLWRAGSALTTKKGDDLKKLAGMMFIYNLEVIILDGMKCADATAPTHRRDQLFALYQPLIAYIRTLPRSTRMSLGTVSLEVESATAPLRKNDDILCSGGLEEAKDGLEAQSGTWAGRAVNAPGLVGKTYAVSPAPGYNPQFVSSDVWQTKQVAVRRAFPASLTRFLTVPGDTPVLTSRK